MDAFEIGSLYMSCRGDEPHVSSKYPLKEGQLEAVTILGEETLTRRGRAGVQGSGLEDLMYFFHTDPPPSGYLLIKQLRLFGVKPKGWRREVWGRHVFDLKNESSQSVLNEEDVALELTCKDCRQDYVWRGKGGC